MFDGRVLADLLTLLIADHGEIWPPSKSGGYVGSATSSLHILMLMMLAYMNNVDTQLQQCVSLGVWVWSDACTLSCMFLVLQPQHFVQFVVS